MSKLTIPDQVLEAHICRVCDKYLTVGPISIHPDGGNVCGRCGKKQASTSLFQCEAIEPEISIPYVIFGYANHLFPCINRFEGCNDLLSFADISQHERKCTGKKLRCGSCLNYRGTGSQLVNHFKKTHPFSFHDQEKFSFKLRAESLLLRRDNFLVFLDVQPVDKRCVQFYLQSSKYLRNEMDFRCLLKDRNGNVIEQISTNKRSADAIYQQIQIEEDIDLNNVLCHCYLKRIFNVV